MLLLQLNSNKLILLLVLISSTLFAGIRSDIDVNADHNILTTSAETVSKGELTFNSYEIAFAGLSYGVTDNLEITSTTLLPMMKGIPFIGMLTGKYKLVDNKNIVLAIQPSLSLVHEGEDIATSTGFSFIMDFILNKDNIITLSQSSIIPISGKYRDISILDYDYKLKDLFFTFTGSLSSRVSNNIKLVIEITAAADYGENGLHMLEDIMLFNYGIRFFNKDLAAMLSFIKPITSNKSNIIMGIPFTTFTARF